MMRIPILLTLLIPLSVAVFVPRFRDTTIPAGISRLPEGPSKPRLRKFGGPTIADLDGDGLYDLIFVHHGPDSVEVYFNVGNGKFEKSSFRSMRDNHCIAPFRLPKFRDRFFTLVPGGNNGLIAMPPEGFRITKDRKIVNVSNPIGVKFYTARGRTAMFLPLQKKRKTPDVFYLNSLSDPKNCPGCTDGQYDTYQYLPWRGRFSPRKVKFPADPRNDLGTTTDREGDGFLEIISWRELAMHKLIGYFKFKDVTRSAFGDLAYANGVAAVAEIDFDNDGDFDLYVARDKLGLRQNDDGEIFPDLLLENRNGKYVDVGVQAGIPRNTISRGVTVGDFNNDGLMDLYVTVYRKAQDVLLLNLGNGKFRSVDVGIGKGGAYGDNAMAVDYDGDGRVDLVRSEGDWTFYEFGGQFRLLQNVERKKKGMGRFVKVRVGHFGRQTSQHAVVTVTAGGRKTMQRVGAAGQSVSPSYFDTLHFGIGRARKAKVKVKWLNGVTKYGNVKAGSMITFGNY